MLDHRIVRTKAPYRNQTMCRVTVLTFMRDTVNVKRWSLLVEVSVVKEDVILLVIILQCVQQCRGGLGRESRICRRAENRSGERRDGEQFQLGGHSGGDERIVALELFLAAL
jgi:hypothetical protein